MTRQRDIFFGTPVDFTMRRKFRRVRKLVGRIEGKRRAAELAGWYSQMRAIAKLSAEFGVFATDVESFIESMGGLIPDDEAGAEYGEWLSDVVDVWSAFHEAGLIRLDGDPRDVANGFRVHVIDFADTNDPRSPARNSSRVTGVTDTPRDVTMDEADRAAVYRENVKRRDAGLPKMTDVERDQWILVTRRHVTSRHVTTEGRGGEGENHGPNPDPVTPDVTDDAPIAATADIVAFGEACEAIDREEQYLPKHQRSGADRHGWVDDLPDDLLHADERDVAAVYDSPSSREDDTSADALNTPHLDSQLRSGDAA